MGAPWDIHPEGDQFLMLKPTAGPAGAAATGPRNMIIVTNWFEELKDRVPVD